MDDKVSTVDVSETSTGLRVVVVDPRPERRELVRHLVASTGLAATGIAEAANALEVVDMLAQEERDVAVVEIQMPVSEGLKTIAALRGRSTSLHIVVCSFLCDPATKALAHEQGADVYLDKPVGSEALRVVLEEFSRQRKPPVAASRARRRTKPV